MIALSLVIFHFFPCFFKKIFIYFNLRLFTLQYCSGFAIYWYESAMDVHVFPILNPSPTSLPIPPSGSSQCTSLELPVSCIEPGLAICFTSDNIHVSMLFSQIIPPLPSLKESKNCSIYLCLFCCLSSSGQSFSFSLRDFLYPWTIECGISSVIWNWLFSDFTTLSFIFTVPVTVITIEFNWLLQTSPGSLVKS